jgi:putative transposase
MVTPAARRQAAAHLCSVHGVSQRRACRAIGVDRTSIRYRSRRSDDGAVRSRLRELAAVRCRFGWRRLQVLLSREGVHVNHKKLRRLYIEERLQVRRRGGRKRALGTWAPMVLPQGPNQRWSMDFVSDTLTDGRRFRILAVVDDYTRESLCLVADTSLSGLRVVRELDALIARRGRPLSCVSDNGTELTSMAILRWSQTRGVDWHYIAPGKPTQSLHRKLQRPAARRALERDIVHLARPGPGPHRGLARRLQHRTTAQRARQSDADRLRGAQRLCTATARGAALNQGLRAPGCCNTGPDRSK